MQQPWEQPGYVTTTDFILPRPGDEGKSQAQLHYERGLEAAQRSPPSPRPDTTAAVESRRGWALPLAVAAGLVLALLASGSRRKT